MKNGIIRKTLEIIGLGFLGVLIIAGALRLVGYKLQIVDKDGSETAMVRPPGGESKGDAGWRREQEQASRPGIPADKKPGWRFEISRQEQANRVPGSGQGEGSLQTGKKQFKREKKLAKKAGKIKDQRREDPAPGSAPSAQAQSKQRDLGSGRSQNVLLPSRIGTYPIPVVENGKESGSFVGKDLLDNVEDTVIATHEGPRKGWAVDKIIAYLKLPPPKGITLIDHDGKQVSVTAEKIQNNQTVLLLTYDGSGSALLASGPKVRGTNRGLIDREGVIEMVSERNDLISVPNIVRIEIMP